MNAADSGRAPARGLTVTAIVAAYNEADIIAQVVADLIHQGVQVYFIDHGSTDGTVDRVRPFVGAGVIAIEENAEIGATSEPERRFHWADILRRKEEIATQVQSDWFIHHDADEFRESPWSNLTLTEAIDRVDSWGYNAIDFALLDFWPTHDQYKPGDDVRTAFPFYQAGEMFNHLQIRCWKNTGVRVDLASSGGHDVQFEGRSVFPLRFLLRHYPIRGDAHGRRKVFGERHERFASSEKARDWHVQYKNLAANASFIRHPSTLTRYEPEAVRFQIALRHRDLEALERELRTLEQSHRELRDVNEERQRELRDVRAQWQVEIAQAQAEIARACEEASRLRSELGCVRADLDSVVNSKSYRWMGPVRALYQQLQKMWG